MDESGKTPKIWEQSTPAKLMATISNEKAEFFTSFPSTAKPILEHAPIALS